MTQRANLVVIHRESLNWQRVASLPETMPQFLRFMQGARIYRSYFSSATSTQMVLAALYHGNDCEFDRMPFLTTPAANNPSLASVLDATGYHTAFLCLTARPDRPMFRQLSDSLPPIWSTNDFAGLGARFEQLIATPPFAIHVCDLSTHVEHAARLAGHAGGTGDLLAGSLDASDRLFGRLLDTLDNSGVADRTYVVAYGDHGDDYFTHGVDAGLVHGTQPYTQMIHVPLAIRGPSVAAGYDDRLASTVDLAPTMADLLGVDMPLPFTPSGASLLHEDRRSVAFSQNFTANQPDDWRGNIVRGFAASDRTHTLLVNARGLRLFNYRLDPTNHTNLLHFFRLAGDGSPRPRQPEGSFHPHFAAGLLHVLGAPGATEARFGRLRAALRAHVVRKNAYVEEWEVPIGEPLKLSAFDRIDASGEVAFLGAHGHTSTARLKRFVLRLCESRLAVRAVSLGHRIGRLARHLGRGRQRGAADGN